MKDLAEARERLHGFFNITVTPFNESGDLDVSALTENLERVLAFSVDGILIGGTYGEFATMSPAERAGLFRRVTEVVGDRVPVILGAASSDPRDAAELTRAASDLGAIPMLTPPFVSEVTDDQIVQFFAELGPLSRTGLVIYNAPGVGITLSPLLLERLVEQPSIVALKQGDLSVLSIDRIANTLCGRIRVFCASDLAFLGPIAAGFDGLSSTNSNGLPELIIKSYRALTGADLATAQRLHRSWFPLREFARRHGQPQTIKGVMRLRGWRGGHVRRPLRDLTSAELTALEQITQTIPSE